MTEDQIKHLANRFLGWAIPDDFHPDNGVHFDGWIGNKGVEGHEYRRHLTGTNLLNANQAEAMVRHIIEGIPPSGEIERLRKHAEATDLWCVMKRRSLEWQMEPYILRGAISDPDYRQLLGQHIAFGQMRSYLSGARRADYPEEK